MYCPNCATEISTGHRYCRSCGVDLQEISQALGGQRQIKRAGTFEETKPERVGASTRVWRRGFYCGVSGLVLVVLQIGVGMVLMVVGIVLMVASYFLRDVPEATPSTRELPGKFPVPSITERTTDLFDGRGPEGPRADSRFDV